MEDEPHADHGFLRISAERFQKLPVNLTRHEPGFPQLSGVPKLTLAVAGPICVPVGPKGSSLSVLGPLERSEPGFLQWGVNSGCAVVE